MNLVARVAARFLRAGALPDSRIQECVESIRKILKDIEHHLGKDPKVRPYDDMAMEFNSIASISNVMSRRLNAVKTAEGSPADDVTINFGGTRPMSADIFFNNMEMWTKSDAQRLEALSKKIETFVKRMGVDAGIKHFLAEVTRDLEEEIKNLRGRASDLGKSDAEGPED